MPDVSFEGFPPLPPPELIHRVIASFGADQGDAARYSFHVHAESALRAVQHGLAAIGRDINGFERMLDFGCGPGRLLRWLAPYAGEVELHGTDIDRDAIEWCEANLPYASFTVAPHLPPTSYADGTFDLVVNHSVFTHLDERYQDLWLAELQRITRPGGVLVLTVHSARQANAVFGHLATAGADADAFRAQLERDGILFVDSDDNIGSSHPAFYRTTYHAPWYIFEHWGRFFELASYIPEGSDTQDLVVLRRREEDAEVVPPIGHGAAPAPASAAAGGDALQQALEYLNVVYHRRPPARTALGRLKRRVLRGEIDRSERMYEALVHVVRQLAAREPRGDALLPQVVVLKAALERQGNRISLLARELRERD
jgi:SAM-dependent methyltransferase